MDGALPGSLPNPTDAQGPGLVYSYRKGAVDLGTYCELGQDTKVRPYPAPTPFREQRTWGILDTVPLGQTGSTVV